MNELKKKLRHRKQTDAAARVASSKEKESEKFHKIDGGVEGGRSNLGEMEELERACQVAIDSGTGGPLRR
jgi:hypothetical protein